jgi:antitoxin VapB
MAEQAPERRASLFRNGRNQAVRIPREFEIAGTHVSVRKEGESLILTPVSQHALADLLATWEPLTEDLPEPDDEPAQSRDPL